MKKWLVILLGLLALAILCFLCIRHHSHDMQNDITERSKATLAETGLPWASATVDGRDVTLTGIAPTAIAKVQAQRIIEGVGGVRAVNNQLTVGAAPLAAVNRVSAASTNPYRTTINYDGNAVTLSGTAPGAAAANRLVSQVRQGLTPSVTNRLSPQGNAPTGWSAATGAIVPQLKRFASAQATVTNNEVVIAGTLAKGSNTATAQRALNAALPRGYNGTYALQAAAASSTPKVCPPIPAPKVCPPVAAPKACPPPAPCAACPAVAECTAETIPLATLEPVSTSEPIVTLYDALSAVDVDAYQGCQNQFNRLLSGGSDVLFRISKAEVTRRGRDVLRSVANAAASCPQANLQVAGHTDSRGGDAMNQALSDRRARAVRNVLVEFGIDDYRLSAVGYGEDSPIATNETIAGRQANRRVEIIVEGL